MYFVCGAEVHSIIIVYNRSNYDFYKSILIENGDSLITEALVNTIIETQNLTEIINRDVLLKPSDFVFALGLECYFLFTLIIKDPEAVNNVYCF